MGQGPAECIECMRRKQCSPCRAITKNIDYDDNIYHQHCRIEHRVQDFRRSCLRSSISLSKWNNFARNFLAIYIIRK